MNFLNCTTFKQNLLLFYIRFSVYTELSPTLLYLLEIFYFTRFTSLFPSSKQIFSPQPPRLFRERNKKRWRKGSERFWGHILSYALVFLAYNFLETPSYCSQHLLNSNLSNFFCHSFTSTSEKKACFYRCPNKTSSRIKWLVPWIVIEQMHCL